MTGTTIEMDLYFYSLVMCLLRCSDRPEYSDGLTVIDDLEEQDNQ